MCNSCIVAVRLSREQYRVVFTDQNGKGTSSHVQCNHTIITDTWVIGLKLKKILMCVYVRSNK